MRKVLLCLLTVFSLSAFASEEEKKSEPAQVKAAEPTVYVASIVRRGENWQQDSLRAFELQEKHLKFLETLKFKNKLIASGPLTTSSDTRGLYIFNVSTIEEAVALTSKDEAISSGWIKMDFHVWTSRDYESTISTSVEESSEELEDDRKLLGIPWQPALLVIFVLWIIVLAYRTFRMKASA